MEDSLTSGEREVLDYRDPESSKRIGNSGLFKASYTAEQLEVLQEIFEENLNEMAHLAPKPSTLERLENLFIRYRGKFEVFLMKALVKSMLNKEEYLEFKKRIDRNIEH